MKKKNLFRAIIAIIICYTIAAVPVYATVDVEANVQEDNAFTYEEMIEQSVNEAKTKAIGYYKRETVVNKERKNKVFCGYATDVWFKSKEYTVSGSVTVSASCSYRGVGTTVGFSKTISTTVPANSSRYSRLGGYADITFQKIKVEEFVGGSMYPYRTSYKVKKTYHDKYVDVVYQ